MKRNTWKTTTYNYNECNNLNQKGAFSANHKVKNIAMGNGYTHHFVLVMQLKKFKKSISCYFSPIFVAQFVAGLVLGHYTLLL